ncbi:tetratricopeptide repeat protein [Paracoccus subflavus]|uniref:Tetratricopeptide repeat protein n=1 Tax=Paracoccus subflavus TaxID=2528244 RepID=A0A4Q9G5S7_9RHOB|nr:tetratricopeptide repeat protein [Paracoccus subflavus]TBN44104.1 tetratricopeptide repeat protein [Paracoccus subflavus]
MPKIVILLLAASLAAALPVDAAPVASDGTARMGDMAMDALSRRQAVDRLAGDLGATGNIGPLLQEGEGLLSAQPDNRLLRHLVATARAAAGQDRAARLAMGDAAPTEAEPWGQIAMALLSRQAGDLATARTAAGAAIAADPANAYARNVAGTIAALHGDLPGAANHFAAAVERGPKGAPFLTNLGIVLAELGDIGRAAQALGRAVELAPDDCPALMALAALQGPAGAPLLARCLEADPGHSDAAARLIQAHLSGGDPDAARRVLDRHRGILAEPGLAQAQIALHEGQGATATAALSRLDPSPDRALLLALAAAMAGDLAAARDHARQAEGVDPSGLVAMGLTVAMGQKPGGNLPDHPLGRAFAALAGVGQVPDGQVLDALTRTGEPLPGLRFEGMAPADLAPLHDDAVRRPLVLGMMLDSAGLAGPARDAFAAAAASKPGAALPELLQARSLGDTDRAAALAGLDRALAASPRLAAAHRLKADLLARAGQGDGALDHLALALAVHDDLNGRLMQGVLAEGTGQDDLARTAYERAVDLDPRSFVALNQLAWFLARQNRDLDRALDMALRADSLQPGNASILDTKGWLLFLTGRTGDAVAALRAAHDADGGRRPEIALHLAQVEAAAGNLPRATELLRDIAAAVPESDSARQEAAALLARIAGG